MHTEKEVALSKFWAKGGGRTQTNVYGYPTEPSEPRPGRDQAGYDRIALVELYNFTWPSICGFNGVEDASWLQDDS